METKTIVSKFLKTVGHKVQTSFIFGFTACLLLSWFYAICSQIIIPLPFNLVPLSIQPLPVILLSLLIGWPAVYAYFLYVAQGALGAPFFAGMLGGVARLVGPTGGYLIGFGLAAIFLAAVREYKQYSLSITCAKIYAATIIYFSCGLAQLAAFVPSHLLLSAGLYPFIIGDFVIKAAIIVASVKTLQAFKK